MQASETASAPSHSRERVSSLRSRISLSKNRPPMDTANNPSESGEREVKGKKGQDNGHGPSQLSEQNQSQGNASNNPSSRPRSEKPLPPVVSDASSGKTSPESSAFFICGSLAAIFITRYVHWLLATVLALTLAYVRRKQIVIANDDADWTRAEQMREKQKVGSTYNQETVEWMNGVLKSVWPLINQDYFVPFIDLMEDALMQQVPGIVHSCRVEDLDQGTVPLRVQSFTLLDPSPTAFIGDLVQTPIRKVHNDTSDEMNEQMQNSDDKPLDVGEYVNLEVTFAYRSPATRRQKAKSNKQSGVMSDEDREQMMSANDSELPVDQIHMLIYMAIGLQKIAAVEVPVWCEVLGIEGRMRIRIQLVPTAPFIGHVAFTFIDKPKLEISAKPLGRRMVIDAMHLPLISSYVLHSVEAVIKDFITPKSYTVDVASLLEVQDGPRNVYSLGVILLVLHQATDLPAPDANGLSDPFVSVSFARAGRRIFTTRVLLRTRDPIWQEVAILLVSPDEARDHEKMRMTVYDADRFSIDDPLGKVEVSIDKLIHRCLRQHNDPNSPSLLETQTENLQPMRAGQKVSGRLSYSVGFFRLSTPLQGGRTASKVHMLHQAASRHNETSNLESYEPERSLPVLPEEQHDPKAHDESDPSLSDYMTGFDRFVQKIGFPLDSDVLRKRMERKARVQKLTSMMEGEAQATIGPPDRQWPSGILCFHIHSIAGLGFEGPQKSWTNSKRLAQKPQYAADEDVLGEGTSRMPNSYVQVLLNDEPIFRTRTKTLNPQPFINAGTERFVCDFNTARIDFVVRDSRQRESDAILGIAALKLDQTLVDTCRSTRWYTLSAGLGFGKIRISLLWRSCELQLPPQLRGCNVGVVEVASCSVRSVSAEHKEMFDKREAHLMFETVGGRAETDNVEPHVEKESEEGDLSSAGQTIGFRWSLASPVRIAVRQRYPNFLYIHLRSDSRMPGRSHKHAHTVIPLNRIEDNKITHKSVPMFESTDWQHFEQNILRDMSTDDQLAAAKESEKKRVAILEQMVADNQQLDKSRGGQDRRNSSESKDGPSLKCIGYLNIDLVIHAGLGPEHQDLVAGDHELRVAYDAFQALTDSSQRPRPKMLTPALRRKLSARVERGRTQYSEIDLGNEQGRSSFGSGRPSSSKLDKDMSRIADGEEGRNDDDDDDEDDDENEEGDGNAFGEDDEDDDTMMIAGEEGDLRARRRSMHRQQRGAAQVKSFRTLQWIKTNTEDGVGRVKRLASRQQNKRIAKMESEGVSHF